MRLTLWSVLLYLSLSQSHAQKLTVQFIENWVSECDSTIKTESEDYLYVLNGVLFDRKEAIEALSNFESSKISIEFINSKNSPVLPHFNGTIISVINHDFQNSRKVIKSTFTRAKKFFAKSLFRTQHISTISQQPILLINGEMVSHNQSKSKLYNLKIRDIFNVSAVKVAPISIYGQNAENGLIQIWLKD